MRLFADEFKLRTAVFLFTASDSFWNVVAGKFFAALAIYGMAIGLTLSWTLLAILYSTPDIGAITGYYIAVLFAGAALISMGIFVSAMTENQLAAAVISSAIYLGMYLLELSKTGIRSEIYIRIVNWISIYSHFNYFSWGIFSFADIVFYLSFSGVFLFLTTKVLELRQLS
jgi:ABC-2 type transport system permease protein